MITISNWFGRFGNNVFQLCHVIFIAERQGISLITFPSHSLLSKNWIRPGIRQISCKDLQGEFFYRKDHPILAKITINDYRRIGRSYLFPLLKTCPSYQRDIDLVIHIRAGDIFNDKPHPYYIQPPLAFYQRVISESGSRKLLLVVEEGDNPVIPVLKGIKGIKIQQASVIQDIWALLMSRELVAGYGTFAVAVFFISPFVRRMTIPDYMLRVLDLEEDDSVRIYQLPNYIIPGKWKNSKEQRELMLSWKWPLKV